MDRVTRPPHFPKTDPVYASCPNVAISPPVYQLENNVYGHPIQEHFPFATHCN